jgi:uncharacterized protein YbjT (DUF2867 family)
LVRQGFKVRAFVFYNSFNSWGWLDKCGADVKGKFEVIQGDIRDPHGIKQAIQGCDAVLHLAALIAIPFSYHSPDTFLVNGSLYLISPEQLKSSRSFFGTDAIPLIITSAKEVIDIDNKEDFILCQEYLNGKLK